ncbi:tetratricopeptide repeat protein [Myxococcaceae bacterium GXIMD 01537]
MAQKSEKITQRELRQPDAFQQIGMEAQGWLAERQKIIVGVIVVAALGGLVAALVSWMGERADRRASKDLGSALAVLERPVAGSDAQAVADPSKPPFATQQEQDEALVKSLTEFREKNSGTHAAATAGLPLGKAQFRLGSFDAAQASFGDFLKGAPANEPLRVSALEGQGYAYEAQGKFAEAEQAFQQMAKEDAGGFLAGMGQYHQARMLILQGKKEEAAKLLSDISEKNPNTAAARQATERLNLLASQGVKLPTAPAAPEAKQ